MRAVGRQRGRWRLGWCACLLPACATVSGVPAPSSERLIAAPASLNTVDTVGLTHLLRGYLFRFRGQPAAAVPHLRLALLHTPASAVVHQRLAEAWFAVGEGERGRRTLARGLGQAPADPWLNLLAGDLAITDGDFARASEHLRRAMVEDALVGLGGALLLDAELWRANATAAAAIAAEVEQRRPADAEAAIGLAQVFEDHGQVEAAMAQYRRARVQNPASQAAAFGEARLFEQQGDPGSAADCLTELFAHYPDEPQLYLAVARLSRQAARADADLYRAEAARQATGDPLATIDLALSDLLEGQVAAVLARLRQAVAEAPGSLGVRLFFADTLTRLGSAKECLDQLTGREVGSLPPVYRARAVCHALAGQRDLALEQTTFALLAAASPREALHEAARYLSQTEAQAQASAALAALVARARVEPGEAALAAAVLADYYGDRPAVMAALADLPASMSGDPMVQLQRADFLARYGELDAALETLTALWRERPSDPVRLNALGFTLADSQRRLREAGVYLRRAYRLSPDQGYITDSLGWWFFRAGQLAPALRLLTKANREAPGEPEILAHLAQVYAALGQHGAARAALQAGLDARPPPALQRMLEGLMAEMEAR